MFFLMLLLSPAGASVVEGCAGCWSGYGPGDERYNKPLADLRVLYEKEGKAALRAIEETLISNPDHRVKQRAATYIGEINDPSSIPVLEGMVVELIKRVSFGNFGVGTADFQTRLKVAHVLAQMGPGDLADRIWNRYDRLDQLKKSEVPYLLNALNDPHLLDRLLDILRRGKDHQAMVAAIEVLAMGAYEQVLSFLRSKLEEWSEREPEPSEPDDPDSPLVHYPVLKLKVEQAIFQLEERSKGSSG